MVNIRHGGLIRPPTSNLSSEPPAARQTQVCPDACPRPRPHPISRHRRTPGDPRKWAGFGNDVETMWERCGNDVETMFCVCGVAPADFPNPSQAHQPASPRLRSCPSPSPVYPAIQRRATAATPPPTQISPNPSPDHTPNRPALSPPSKFVWKRFPFNCVCWVGSRKLSHKLWGPKCTHGKPTKFSDLFSVPPKHAHGEPTSPCKALTQFWVFFFLRGDQTLSVAKTNVPKLVQ